MPKKRGSGAEPLSLAEERAHVTKLWSELGAARQSLDGVFQAANALTYATESGKPRNLGHVRPSHHLQLNHRLRGGDFVCENPIFFIGALWIQRTDRESVLRQLLLHCKTKGLVGKGGGSF